MENDDFDIMRKVIFLFADENRPSSDVQREEQIALNLVDDSDEHYCLEDIANGKSYILCHISFALILTGMVILFLEISSSIPHGMILMV